MTLRFATAAALAAGLLSSLGTGCRAPQGPAGDPEVLALVDGRPLTREEFQAYLRNALGDEPEPAAPTHARLLSRLLDQFVREAVLEAEARRRGIRVEPWEVDEYLAEQESGDVPAGDGTHRRLVARHLAVRKLRTGVLGEADPPSLEEIRDYFERHRERLMPETAGLRVLALEVASEREGRRIRAEILRREMPFAEAVATFGLDPETRIPQVLRPDELPETIAEAVSDLEPGGVSRPVEYLGRWFLFSVEPVPPEGPESEARGLELAAAAMAAEWGEQRDAELLEQAYAEVSVQIFWKNLPFTYVPDRRP